MLDIPKFRICIALSLLLHVVILGAFIFSFQSSKAQVIKLGKNVVAQNKALPEKKVIKARIFDQELVQKAMARQQNQEQAKLDKIKSQQKQIQKANDILAKTKKEMQNMQKKLDLAKIENVKYQKELNDKETKKKMLLSEIDKKKNLLQEEKDRLSDVQKKKIEAEQAYKALKEKEELELQAKKEKELQEKQAKERALELAKKNKARQDWLHTEYSRVVSEIQTSVIEKRNLISAFSDDLVCEVQFRLLSDGNVTGVQIIKSSGNQAYDDSAKMAVYKAAPFDIPNDQELLSKLRDIILVFTKDIDNV